MATVAVVGLGLMGASFSLALKRARPDHFLVGSEHDQRTVRKALDRGIVDSAGPDLDIVDVADVVVLAVPILATVRVLIDELWIKPTEDRTLTLAAPGPIAAEPTPLVRPPGLHRSG